MDIAFVTDSTADIPAELADQYGIHIVANTLVIEGQSLEDGRGISRHEFYARLPNMKTPPTTAAASSGSYQALYETLLSRGFGIVLSIHASSLLSGIFNAASVAAQAFQGRVQVIDSGQVSLGLGFQVLEAAEEARLRGDDREGNLAQVLERLSQARERVRVVAMLDTLEYVRRSGRVSWAKARLGDLLNVKPFLEVREGQVFSRGEARTYRKGVERLHQMLAGLGPLKRLAILHSNAEAEARQFLADARQQPASDPLIVNITSVIGAHIGPHALGFSVVIA